MHKFLKLFYMSIKTKSTKEKLLTELSGWYESDINLLIKAINNSKLKIPYTMGEGKILTDFQTFTKTI